MQNYKNTVQDLDGAVAVGASVLVNLGGTVTAATIYSDDGVTAAANPLTTDANGQFTFWAAPGLYDLVISGSTFPTRYWNGIQLYDMVAAGAPWFDVTDTAYGAVGDGVTDDSAAIQAAIDAVPAGGGVVYFPPGKTFLIEANVVLESNLTLTGRGVVKSGIATTGVPAGYVFYALNKENILVDGLEINGASVAAVFNGTAYPGIFLFNGCDNVTVRNCHIYDSGADAMQFSSATATVADQCTNVIVDGCVIEDCRRDGIVLEAVDGALISNNHITGTFGAGIDIEPYTSRVVENVVIRGNRCHCERTTDFDLDTWPRSFDCTTASGTIGAVTVDGNYFSYVMPDVYLATAAADVTQVTMQVFILGVTGPMQFTNNTIYTNQLSIGSTNYGILTFGGSGVGVTNGLTCSGNTIYRPETTPAVADGKGRAGWRAYVVRGTNNLSISGDRIKGSFNEPLWMFDCDNATVDIQIENTADSVLANVTSAATLDTCNNVKLTGYFSSPDNTIVLDTVDGLLVEGAILKSANAGVHIRNQGAASGNVAAIGCMVDQSNGLPFPSTLLSRNNDGNAISYYTESGTVDSTLTSGGVSGTGVYNVSSYGATGDGATDDAAAIQAAIDAAEAGAGGVVFFPPGYFRIGTALTVEGSGITLQGSGMGQEGSTAYGTVLGATAVAAFGPLLTIGVSGARTYGSGIKDISLWSPNYSVNGMLKFLNTTECFAIDSRIDLRNADDDGRIAFYVYGENDAGYGKATANRINRCHIQSPKTKTGAAGAYGYGLVFENGGAGYVTANTITDCKFYNGSVSGAPPNAGYAIEDGGGANFYSGCHVGVAGERGVSVLGQGTVFTNCNIDGDGPGTVVLRFESTSSYCYFMGHADGDWDDDVAGDGSAYVLSTSSAWGPAVKTLRFVPRAAAPDHVVGAGEGNLAGEVYYDSDDSKLKVWTGAAWETITSA